jgi:hypothetical protein
MSRITPEGSHVSEVVGEKNDSAILAATEDVEEQNDGTPRDEDTFVYLNGWALWSLALALMGSGFMLSLDSTILGTDLRVCKIAMPI